MSQVAFSRPASQMGGGKTPGVPNLPEIQHPLSRLGNPGNINVRGLSSSHGKRPATSGGPAPRGPMEVPFQSNLTPRLSRSAAGFGPRDGEITSRKSLPKIPHLYTSIPEGVEVVESSDPERPTIPVFGNRADMSSRLESRGNIASRVSNRPGTQIRLEVDEIELLLKEKMKKGYFEIRKLFISNDPDGRGTVSRDALSRIIINFAGRFVGPKHFNNLMARLGLADKQMIKLEEFYACFREPVGPQEMPGWMDPVNRYSGDKPIMSAAQVHLQLKEKAKQRLLDVAEIVPQMNPGGSGRILKPEFRNALQKLLFFMDDDEFEKLWAKYDTDGYGVINGEKLMNKLGISLRSGFTPAPVPEYGRRSVSPPNSPTQISPRRSLRKAEMERKKSLDVERWLKDKFREGCTRMRREFETLDKAKLGQVEREEFRKILMKFGLKLDSSQLENFLARCNMTNRKDGKVLYREFLQQFQDRSESGVPHKILCNPTHRFNLEDHRAGSPGAASSITTAEARIMSMFQGDFLALLGTFHKIDKLGLNVISQQEFRAAIESKFNFDLSEAEFEAFMDKVPMNDEGEVKYAQFMSQFDSRGGPAPSLFDAKSVYAPGHAEDMEIDDDHGPLRFDDFKSMRSNEQLSALIKKIVVDRLSEVEAVFRDIDESNSGKLSQEDMYQLFQKLHVRPEITRGEIRRLWDTFITTSNRFLSFEEFVRHFGFSLKSRAFPNAKHSPPKRGDSDFLIRSRKLNCAADMLEDNLRSKIDYKWDDLRKEFLELDPYGTGFVSGEEFKDVIQELCVQLNNYELQQLCKKFDTRADGRVSYLEFLKPVAKRKATHRYANQVNEVLNHPQPEIPLAPIVDEPHKGLSGISARLRQQLVGDWKNMRRAFQKLDTGRTGYLSVPEFRAVLQLCNVVLGENEVYNVMSEFDERMDGKINYNKFLSNVSGAK